MYVTRREILMLGSVVAVAIAVISSRGGTKPTTAPPEKGASVVTTTLPAGAASCGDVLDQCDARVELKVPHCGEEDIVTATTEALGVPMRIEKCKQIYDRLHESCVAGCVLEEKSVLTIPGKIRSRILSEADESGACLVRAERQISFRGICKK